MAEALPAVAVREARLDRAVQANDLRLRLAFLEPADEHVDLFHRVLSHCRNPN